MASPVQARKPELRKDSVTSHWVVFSPARAKRPSDFKSNNPADDEKNSAAPPKACPFCIGHEHECAPEIFRLPPATDDWKIRVIQNLYPAVSRTLEDPFAEQPESDSWATVLGGFGFHDVVIESPVHSIQLVDLAKNEVGEVVLAYKKRIQQIESEQSIQYVQVFKNHGRSAGASMTHSHSQIVAIPIIPPTVSNRLGCMKEYYNQTGKCSICDVQTKDLLIDETNHFFSIVPFAATYPFEIWIIPRDHTSHFHEIDAEKAVDLGGLLKLLLRKMCVQLNNPPFNFMIHTAPLRASESQLPYIHWYIQIVPQLTGIGGFELGTACYINPVFPEDAAKVMREVDLPM